MAFENKIYITSPLPAQLLDKYSSQVITWNSAGDIANVSIHYSTDGAVWTQIVANTPNDGSYTWDTSSLAIGTTYQIQIRNYVSPSLFGTSEKFSIQNRRISDLKPTASSLLFKRKSKYKITYNKSESIDMVDIALYKSGVSTTTIASNFKGDTFIWEVGSGETLSADYKIRVSASDDATNYAESGNNFKIVDESSLTITAPTDGSVLQQKDTSYNITWTTSGSVQWINIDLFKNNNLILNIAKSVKNDLSYLWEYGINFTLGSDYSIRVSDATRIERSSSVNISIGDSYIYESKITNFYSTSSTSTFYLPLSGYIVEKTSVSSSNEYIGMIAPYDGRLEKLMFRSEYPQDGTFRVRMNVSNDGIETPLTGVLTHDTTIDIDDDTSLEIDPNDGNAVGSTAITKGQIFAVSIKPPSAPYDTNITLVFRWDITT